MVEKCHQRIVRDRLKDDHPVPEDFSTATVREISYAEAKAFILKYEWLGNMGTTARTFGLFFGDELAAVECFGHPGSEGIKNICGKEHEDKVYWIARGACAPWVPDRGAASYLIARSCEMMGQPWKTAKGREMSPKFAFLATGDTDAGEVGQVYQSSNWLYLGKTTVDRMFLKPGQPKERAKSYRVLVKGPIRNRTGRIQRPDSDGRRHFLLDGVKYYKGDTTAEGEYIGGSDKYPLRWNKKYGTTEKEALKVRLEEVLAEGYEEVKGNRKHLYIGFYGDRRMKRTLRAALKRKVVVPYPKRGSVQGNSTGTPSESLVRTQDPAPNSPPVERPLDASPTAQPQDVTLSNTATSSGK
jgi:hypothetical protein